MKLYRIPKAKWRSSPLSFNSQLGIVTKRFELRYKEVRLRLQVAMSFVSLCITYSDIGLELLFERKLKRDMMKYNRRRIKDEIRWAIYEMYRTLELMLHEEGKEEK